MENLVLYLGKVSILLTIFFLAYFFLLRKETFFNANRWYLLAGILTSVTLPFVLFKKVILVEPVVRQFIPMQNNIVFQQPDIVLPEPSFVINWFYVLIGIYVAGMLFFLYKFTKDLWALYKILKNQKIQEFERFKLLDTNTIQLPFSFFNYIVFNSNQFKQIELENILEHEKVHSSQYHSADMILSQLFCIVFWFNPFAWFHKKAIAQNLEFIADSQALKIVPDRIIYQKTLLKVSAPHQCIPITNHFFQSLIKKRIVMLNKNQSKRRNSFKYLAVLPLLTIFMLQFQVETVAQEKPLNEQQETSKQEVEIVIDKNSSDSYLKEKSETLKKEGVTLRFSKVKRNSNNEIIAIKTSYKGKNGNSADNFQKSDSPIQPFKIVSNDNEVMIGSLNSSIRQNSRNNKASSSVRIAESNMPVAPVPPAMPEMPNIGNIPVPATPVMPPAPTAPSVAYDENNKDWKKFEEQMKQFEIQMKSKEGEFAKFEKEMEKYGEQIEKAFSPEFEKQMAEFEKKMEKFEAEMEVYQEKIQAQGNN